MGSYKNNKRKHKRKNASKRSVSERKITNGMRDTQINLDIENLDLKKKD